eukprot:3382463-Rhodomonas_salina.1
MSAPDLTPLYHILSFADLKCLWMRSRSSAGRFLASMNCQPHYVSHSMNWTAIPWTGKPFHELDSHSMSWRSACTSTATSTLPNSGPPPASYAPLAPGPFVPGTSMPYVSTILLRSSISCVSTISFCSSIRRVLPGSSAACPESARSCTPAHVPPTQS